MRSFITVVSVVVAFAIGVVATGYLGDQGRGFEVLPLVVGWALAVIVLAVRLTTGRKDRA